MTNTTLPEFFQKQLAEQEVKCAQDWKDFLVAFVKGLDEKTLKSTFPLDMGGCGTWEVTMKRTSWASNEEPQGDLLP